MISYTSARQLTLEGFEHPFEKELGKNNRWVVLAQLIPWDALASVYSQDLETERGRLSVDVRMVIGALIIKHKLKLSDRETVAMISENIYMQFFCGLKSFQTQEPFDASLFVDIRKRMGAEKFDRFNELVIERSQQLKPKRKRVLVEKYQKQDVAIEQTQEEKKEDVVTSAEKEKQAKAPTHKGKLKIDATVADQQIRYPTDLGLLNCSREESQRLIDILCAKKSLKTKPRTYRRKARRDYLSIPKKNKKNKKQLRKSIGQQVRYLRRNLKSIEKLLDLFEGEKFPFKLRDQRIYWVIQLIYEQQLFMYQNKVHRCPDRIVNVYQPYVRPIVRGKDKAVVEFGSKLSISEYEGMSKIDRIGWNAFNEATDLQEQVQRYKQTWGCYPELLLADRIYLNRANRDWLKQMGIRIVGKPLGRPPLAQFSPYQKRKQRKERNQRNLVEGKIGQGKNGYALNCIKARRQDTSESWIAAIFFIMNLTTLAKVAKEFFLSFFYSPLHERNYFLQQIFMPFLSHHYKNKAFIFLRNSKTGNHYFYTR